MSAERPRLPDSLVTDKVPVALTGAELDGEATGVTSIVARARLSTDGREADGEGALRSLLEQVGNAEVGEVLSALPLAVGTGTLGVDDTLGDTLAVEVGEEVWRTLVSCSRIAAECIERGNAWTRRSGEIGRNGELTGDVTGLRRFPCASLSLLKTPARAIHHGVYTGNWDNNAEVM